MMERKLTIINLLKSDLRLLGELLGLVRGEMKCPVVESVSSWLRAVNDAKALTQACCETPRMLVPSL